MVVLRMSLLLLSSVLACAFACACGAATSNRAITTITTTGTGDAVPVVPRPPHFVHAHHDTINWFALALLVLLCGCTWYTSEALMACAMACAMVVMIIASTCDGLSLDPVIVLHWPYHNFVVVNATTSSAFCMSTPICPFICVESPFKTPCAQLSAANQPGDCAGPPCRNPNEGTAAKHDWCHVFAGTCTNVTLIVTFDVEEDDRGKKTKYFTSFVVPCPRDDTECVQGALAQYAPGATFEAYMNPSNPSDLRHTARVQLGVHPNAVYTYQLNLTAVLLVPIICVWICVLAISIVYLFCLLFGCISRFKNSFVSQKTQVDA